MILFYVQNSEAASSAVTSHIFYLEGVFLLEQLADITVIWCI